MQCKAQIKRPMAVNEHRLWRVVLSLFLVTASQAVVAQETSTSAPFEFEIATPESQGMSGEKLEALKDSLAQRRTKAFLIIRNDKIVYEWYAAGHAADAKHGTASL